eukprot:Blabericola_migrator_1__5262@NODE_2702_length_2442_cov_560_344000_g1690_i0_p1_GENE_NODE_2702_length_2442_cov_560_344000_g1690_i0NODE_2702_length_2442_cov_560_344000_g1690_i0_p1_ORF_typecomplete_len236_score56_51Beta_helix_2/PF18835_1/0_093_NODE_2702_length_2442_cov_560_344000_g1690_i08521559
MASLVRLALLVTLLTADASNMTASRAASAGNWTINLEQPKASIQIIETGTILDECGGACGDFLNSAEKQFWDLVNCIISLARHSECKLTYAAPAGLTVVDPCPEDDKAVRVQIKGTATWIFGTELGSLLEVAPDVDEKEACEIEVYEGNDCTNTQVVGTLNVVADSKTQITLSGSSALLKAKTKKCAARLTEEYLTGKTIVVAVGGGGVVIGSGGPSTLSVGVTALGLGALHLYK